MNKTTQVRKLVETVLARHGTEVVKLWNDKRDGGRRLKFWMWHTEARTWAWLTEGCYLELVAALAIVPNVTIEDCVGRREFIVRVQD